MGFFLISLFCFPFSSAKSKSNTLSPMPKQSLENVKAHCTSPKIDILLSQHPNNQINCNSNLNKRNLEPTQRRRSARVMACKIQGRTTITLLSSSHHNISCCVTLTLTHRIRPHYFQYCSFFPNGVHNRKDGIV